MNEIYSGFNDIPEGASQGASEKAREQFSEQQKKAQSQAKQAYVQEQKAKKNDTALSQFILSLLQGQGDEQLMALLIDLLDANIPSSFLISLLSLLFPELSSQESKTSSQEKSQNLQIPGFSPDISFEISQWVAEILEVSRKNADKIFETMIVAETWEVHPSLQKFAYRLLLEKVSKTQRSISSEQIEVFITSLFERLLSLLQKEIN